MIFLRKLEKNKSFWAILIFSLIFFLLRFPSLFEPLWYGDEGVYQAVGMLINDGARLFSGAWDNKPPLLLVIYAIFNSDQFVIRTVSLIFGLFSVWVFYLISTKLFTNSKKAALLSTLIFTILFGSRVIEGNIANSENFMLLPILLTSYLIISLDNFTKKNKLKFSLIAGLFLSSAFLVKIVAIFDFAAFSLFILLAQKGSTSEKLKEKFIPFVSGFSIPVFLIFLYFILTNNFKDFFDAFLLENVGYVGLENNFIIPNGLLYFKILILFIFVGFVFYFRKNFSKNFIFISLWFAFGLFNAFFSNRPYTHYLLIFLPSFSLLVGGILNEKREKIYLVVFLIFALILIKINFETKHSKFIDYYLNLFYYCSGRIDSNTYQSFFDNVTPRDYDIARYIKTHTNKNDSVFIWGNNAQVYNLSEKTPIMRYTVAYHITNFPTGVIEMENAINTKKPKLIVVMPNASEFPLSLMNYQEKMDLKGAKIYEKIY